MARNGNKIFLGIVGIVLLLAVVFYIAGKGGLSTVSSGATVLSVSNARFVSNAPDVGSQDAYLIDAVVNKGGEKVVGTITPDDIKKYGITQTPSGPITIEFDLNSVSCNYQIVDDEKAFYKIYQATVRKSLCGSRCSDGCAATQAIPWNLIDLSTVKSACAGSWGVASRAQFNKDGTIHAPEMCGKTYAPPGSDLSTPSSTPDSTDCGSLVDIQTTPIRPDVGQQASEWGYLMPSQMLSGYDGDHWVVTHIAGAPKFTGNKIDTVVSTKFKVNVKITNANGETFNTTISDENTVAALGDIGRIKFAGSLLAQEFCPVPAVEKAILESTTNHTFQVVQKTMYDQYQSTLFDLRNFDNNYFTVENRDPGVGADTLWSKMSSLNSLLRVMSSQSETDSCVIEGRIYKCTPQRDIVYPQMQLIVKASWVGVKIDSGVPSIVSVSPTQTSYSGEVTPIRVGIANVGTLDDSFDVGLACNDVATSLGNVRVSVGAGNTQSLNLNYLMQAGNYSCKITAASVNNPLAKTSKVVDLEIINKPIPVAVSQCTVIPSQPSQYCLWEGYPECAWKCTAPPQDKSGLYMTIIVILTAMFIAVVVYFRRK